MVGKPLAEPTRSAIDAAAFTTVSIMFSMTLCKSPQCSRGCVGSQHGIAVRKCQATSRQLEPKYQTSYMSSPSGYVSTHALYMHTLSCAKGTHWAYRLQSLLQSPSRCPHRYMRVSSTHSAAKCCVSQTSSHRSNWRGSMDLARAIENRFAVLNLSRSTDFARRVSRSSWEFSTSSRVKRVLTSLI